MWDPPGLGLEPVSPALAGRFLTTAPPGKSPGVISDIYFIQFLCTAIFYLMQFLNKIQVGFSLDYDWVFLDYAILILKFASGKPSGRRINIWEQPRIIFSFYELFEV